MAVDPHCWQQQINGILIADQGGLVLPNTPVSPGVYGDATHVGQFTVGADGRLTAAANVAIATGGSALWTFRTPTTMADPGSGSLRFDTASPVTVANMALSATTSGNTDATRLLASLTAGDQIYIQDQGNTANWIRFRVTGPPVNMGGWFQIPVTLNSSGAYGGALPANNSPLLVTFGQSGAGAGGGSGTVTSVAAGTGLVATPASPITTSGTIALAIPVAVASGGSGQTTANAALNAFLPPQAGNAARFLQTDGLNTAWVAAPSLPPSGAAGGDLAGSTYPNPVIAANAVTLAKQAQVTAPVLRGRATAGLGNLEDLTPAQATALLSVFGIAGSGAGQNLQGLVPPPGAGTTPNNFRLLRDNGTWCVPTGQVLAWSFNQAQNSTTAVYPGFTGSSPPDGFNFTIDNPSGAWILLVFSGRFWVAGAAGLAIYFEFYDGNTSTVLNSIGYTSPGTGWAVPFCCMTPIHYTSGGSKNVQVLKSVQSGGTANWDQALAMAVLLG